jgi:hypothetical protein
MSRPARVIAVTGTDVVASTLAAGESEVVLRGGRSIAIVSNVVAGTLARRERGRDAHSNRRFLLVRHEREPNLAGDLRRGARDSE